MLGSIRVIVGWVALIIMLLSWALGFYWYKKAQHILPQKTQESPNNTLEQKHLSLVFYDLSLKKKALSSFKDKVLVLNFWATWCAPCVEELPSLNRLAGHFPKKLRVLALSNERTDTIKNFLMAFPDFHSHFMTGNVSRSEMLSAFPVRAFPETYILDTLGNKVEKVSGSQKWDSSEWKQKIKFLIKKANNTPKNQQKPLDHPSKGPEGIALSSFLV